MTESIETQFQQTSVALSSALENVYSSSKSVADSADDISSVFNSSTQQISSIYNSLISYQGQIDSTLDTPNSYFIQINDGFYAAWSINIIAAIIGLVGAIGVYLFKWARLRILLHCSWCCMSLLMIIGFALSSIFVPVGIITMEACDLFNDIISSEAFYSEYTEIIPSDINSQFQTCLFGTGDLLSEFGISNQVDQMNNIYSALNNLTSLSSSMNMKSNISNSSSSINYSDTLINIWQNQTHALEYGLQKDSNYTDDNNSFISIQSFNEWSDYGSSGSLQAISCSYTQDNWVFNTSNCTYTTKWSNTSSPTDQIGSQICIQIQDFDNAGANSRYSSMGNCSSSVSQNNLNYFGTLKNYDNSRRTLFSSLGNDLTNLKINNDYYNSELLSFNTTVFGFIKNITTFINSVSDPNNGLIAGFNCAFLRTTVRNSYNAMCVSLFIPVYLQIIFILTTSMLMFLMSLLAYLAGMRFGKLHKQADVDTWGGESKN